MPIEERDYYKEHFRKNRDAQAERLHTQDYSPPAKEDGGKLLVAFVILAVFVGAVVLAVITGT